MNILKRRERRERREHAERVKHEQARSAELKKEREEELAYLATLPRVHEEWGSEPCDILRDPETGLLWLTVRDTWANEPTALVCVNHADRINIARPYYRDGEKCFVRDGKCIVHGPTWELTLVVPGDTSPTTIFKGSMKTVHAELQRIQKLIYGKDN